jgi:hypothetical protein
MINNNNDDTKLNCSFKIWHDHESILLRGTLMGPSQAKARRFSPVVVFAFSLGPFLSALL